VVAAARLHRAGERRKTGLTVIEGPHTLEEAVLGGGVIEVIFAHPDDEDARTLAAAHRLDLVEVDETALSRVAGTKTPRGPVAVIHIPSRPVAATSPGLLVAWSVGDPGNVGTLIRTAAAFGWGFGHGAGTADPWSPKVLRSGAGAHFRIGIEAFSGVDELTARGYSPLAAVVSGGIAPDRLAPGRYALLVGDEALGLPAEVVEASQDRVTITMPGGTESLNVAMAAGIIVYELAKPERQDGGRV
jgi:TrmH family RNA methyltransferase